MRLLSARSALIMSTRSRARSILSPFSRAATSIARRSEAMPKWYSSMPCTFRLGWELIWMETKRSALCSFANFARSSSSIKVSVARVINTFLPSRSWRSARRRRATSRTTSFSVSPLRPIAPGSFPPWPASTTIVSMSRRAWR